MLCRTILPADKSISRSSWSSNNEIKTIFNEWKWEGEYHLELDSQVIELFITEQFVRFDCYNVTLDVMNIIIDIMNEYECPLYDSAISTRFEL